MATYVIGDVQGCFRTFESLLLRIAWRPERDRLWFVGDLVNRGPDSAGMLDFALRHQDRITAVLGNHELHLLSVIAGARKLRGKDTLEPVLSANALGRWIDLLRSYPVAHVASNAILVHAGVLPRWSATELTELDRGVREELTGRGWEKFLGLVQESDELRWDRVRKRRERLALALKAMTMLRVVQRASGDLDLSFKGEPQDAPKSMVPWFDHPERRLLRRRICFGHWAGLGLFVRDDVVGLDSGCVWGHELTALRLDDDAIFQVAVEPGDAVAAEID